MPYDAVKAATVAIALWHPERPGTGNRPFSIIGSGFCINSEGVIVTCAHVHRATMEQDAYQRILENSDELLELEGSIPHAIFYLPRPVGDELFAYPCPARQGISKTDRDLAVFKISPHRAFPDGFPTLPIADYDQIHETMEIGTCGFPLGCMLQDQIGTVTSSFTRGMISSIAPSAGVPREHVRNFQLNLTATHGSSGGPVFSTETGEVFGVLTGGVTNQLGEHVAGLTIAEPVYPLFDDNAIERLLAARPPENF